MVEQKIDSKIVISDESDNFLQEVGQVGKSRVQGQKSIEKRAVWRSLDCRIEEFEESMGKDVFRTDSSCFCGRRKRDKKKRKRKPDPERL